MTVWGNQSLGEQTCKLDSISTSYALDVQEFKH